MKQTKVLGALAGVIVLFGFASAALAYTPTSYQFGYTDSSGPETANLSPAFPDTGDLFSTDPTTGQLTLLQVGSGLIDTGADIEVHGVIADKVITPNGDPLGYWITTDLPANYVNNSTFSGLSSTVSSLSASLSAFGAPLNIAAFMGNNASTSPFIASSTQNGFMSATMASKLTALNASTSIAYEGTTQRVNSFPIFKSATVASGVAVFNLTADGTSGGTALCTNGVIQDSVNANANDATASYQWSYAFSNSNKTVTITVNKLSTANILTGVLGQSAANGAVVKMSVYCY